MRQLVVGNQKGESRLKEVGQYIKSLRKEKNLTIKELAEISGVSNAYLSQIENGKRGLPSIDILSKIAPFLEKNAEDLIYVIHGIDLTKTNEETFITDEHPLIKMIHHNDLTSEQIHFIYNQIKATVEFFQSQNKNNNPFQ